MRLLLLTSRLPYPPNRGDRLRAYHFIRSLAQDHELHLLSFIASEAEREHIAPLQAFCQSIQVVEMPAWRSALVTGLNLWRDLPLQALYYRSREMQRLVDQTLASQKFDAAYIHLFRMVPYLDRHPEIYRIVDLTDVVSKEVKRSLAYRSLPSRLLYMLEGPRIERYERRAAREMEETWLISEEDANLLRKSAPGANIQVVRNGVDTEKLHPTGEQPVPGRLVLVGHLGVHHNVDAARHLVEDILPLVRQEIPEATMQLVGAEPNETVQALGKLPGVQVAGFVPDLNQALNQAAVFAAPLRFAAGVQNKVLEAMAAGRPVVTTSLVNAGIGALPERDLLVGDEPKAFARQIIRLLNDAALSQRIGLAGREFVKREFNWRLVRERMGEIKGKVKSEK